MKKVQKASSEFKIIQFNFVVRPREIIVKPKMASTYHLEFNKGPQILKKFEQKINVNGQNKNYQLLMQEECQFKLQNQRNCKFQWAIYKQYDDDAHEFIDSIEINIQDYYLRYINRLKDHSQEYYKIIANKSSAVDIIRSAEILREKLLPKEVLLKENNKDNTITICYDIEIKNMVDHLAELETSRLKKTTSKSVKSISIVSSQAEKQNQIKINIKKKGQEESKISSIIKNTYANVNNSLQKEQFVINEREPIEKKSSLLSDIMEASNSNQSNINYGRKNQQQEARSEVIGIPEEQNQSSSPIFISGKTKSFDPAKFTGFIGSQLLKRSSTQNQDQTEQVNVMKSRKDSNDPQNRQESIDAQLQKEQLQIHQKQTRVHSEINTTTPDQVKEIQPVQTKITIKIIIFIVLIVTLLSSLFILRKFLMGNKPKKVQKAKISEKVKGKPQKSKKSKNDKK